MAHVKFYPEKRLDKTGNLITKNVPLFLNFSLRGKRLSYFTGQRFDLGKPTCIIAKGKEKTSYSNWDEVKFSVSKSLTGNQLINTQIAALRNIIESAEIRAAKSQYPLTLEDIKRELDIFRGKILEAPRAPEPEPAIELGPLQVLDRWIIERTEKEAASSVKNIKVFRTHLTAFAKPKISFLDIDGKFYEAFRAYLRNVKKHSINTEAKLTKLMARFLKYCDKQNYPVNQAYKSFDWVSEDVPDVIAINEEELKLLEAAVMPTASLERVKNVFLFQLYCGMRFADVENLKKEDVNGDYIRFFILKKTKGRMEHTVALNRKAREILELYKDIPGNRALPVLSNQKTNSALKLVGKEAGLNTIVKKKMVYGNKAVITLMPKHALLSTHMARKGFISIAISKNILESKIKAQTGHDKNSRAFARYYDVRPEDKKDMVDEIFGL